jgi:CRISPR-associated endonuclease/helicase Cas3
MDYIAHIREKDKTIQTVEAHLREVKEYSERRGRKIGVKHLAGIAGWLHDFGKNTNEFYNYIQQAAANTDAPPKRGSVDHSTAGGRFISRRYHEGSTKGLDKVTAEWIANCIISHHGGLRDFVSAEQTSPFMKRVVETELKEYDQAEREFLSLVPVEELDRYFASAAAEVNHLLGIVKQHKLSEITPSLLIKYMFSCLIDADRTSTRIFEEGTEPEQPIDHAAFFGRAYDALQQHLHKLETGKNADHPINRLRREMSRQCEEFALKPSGIYTLSIPTGGGKTLASLRYALRHAIEHGKERIIYIVPYTTIIEQNADEIRKIIKEDDMILEHHSNVIDEDKKVRAADTQDSGGKDELEDEAYDFHRKKLKLARDNWDRPIIFTTMVQFLNTFYAKGTRNVRRLHQLSNAVIIFDEVQSVPVNCISLFNSALNFLNILGHSSLVLCTATQPALDFVKHGLRLSEQPEMIGNLAEVGKSFKRVEIVDRTTPLGWKADQLGEFVLERMDEVKSTLIILNTKTAARKLYDELHEHEGPGQGDFKLFHLSTNMCAAHRKEVLKEMKKALKAEERLVCVSTQLIEAGVDISFECVVRSLAGLDSIAQAAGRCNRHGKDALRQVYIIKSADESLKQLKEIQCGADQTTRLLAEFKEQPELYGHELLSAAAVKQYFEYYFAQMKDEMHYRIKRLDQNLFQLLGTNRYYLDAYKNKHGKLPGVITPAALATAEQHFEAISNRAIAVLVPYGEAAKALIADLNGELDIRKLGDLLKQSQQYVVNIYDHDRKKLERNGDLYPLLHGHVLALREPAYNEFFGVESEGEGVWQDAVL